MRKIREIIISWNPDAVLYVHVPGYCIPGLIAQIDVDVITMHPYL